MTIAYVELVASFTAPGSDGVWTDYDIFTNHGVPKGAIVEIALCNGTLANENLMGVRADGSALNRYISIHEAEDGGEVVYTMPVKVHSTTGLIEVYMEDVSDLHSFRILGYFTGCDFIETMATTAISTIGAWTDLDLGTANSRVHSVIISSANQDVSWNGGVRTKGSSLERKLSYIHEPEANGGSGLMFYVKSDASDIIQYWINEGTSKSLIDLGYFGQETDFVENWQAFEAGLSATWNSLTLPAWVQKAAQYGSETHITSLCVLNGEIYGGTIPNGNLLKWNGTAWVQVAPKYGSETGIWSLVVLNGQIYGGTNPNGLLLRWNGSGAWVQVASKYGSETYIDSLCVLNGQIYGGTFPNGNLLRWNGSSAWVQVAPLYGSETAIYSLCVLNGVIYGGTSPNGNLLKWNGTSAWVQVASKYSTETDIRSLCVLNGYIYGGTYPSANLLKWNGSNAWVQVAPEYGTLDSAIYSLCVLNGEIYGGTGDSYGYLLKWNGSNAWTLAAPKLSESIIRSLCILSEQIYGGTGSLGNLYKYEPVDVNNFVSLILCNYSPDTEYNEGARKGGSSLARYILVHESEGATYPPIEYNGYTITVGISVSATIELYTGNTSFEYFIYTGYFKNGLQTINKTFKADARVVRRPTKALLADAWISTRFTKPFTVDANLISLGVHFKDFTADAILLKPKAFTVDAVIVKRFTKSPIVDAVIVKRSTKPFTADARLASTKTFTADAVLTSGVKTKTFTADGRITGAGHLVGTSTDYLAITFQYQRKSFRASGLFWVFYSNGTNMVYRTSSDGATWSAATTVRAAADGYEFSIWFDGQYLHYAHASGVRLRYRRGFPKYDGSITWSTINEQNLYDAWSGITKPFVSVDSNGYPWIGYMNHYGFDICPFVNKCDQNNGTWTSHSTYQLSTVIHYWDVSVIPLTDGKMYITYAFNGDTVKGRLWTGSMGGEETASFSSIRDSVQHSVVADPSNNVYLEFVTYIDPYCYIKSRKRTYSTGLWGSETTVKANIPYYAFPVLSIRDTTLYCFWSTKTTNTPPGAVAEHIYYQTSTDGGANWSAMVDWINQSSDPLATDNYGNSRPDMTCFYRAYGNFTGLVYLTGGVNPWKVRFAYFPLNFPWEAEKSFAADAIITTPPSSTKAVTVDAVLTGIPFVKVKTPSGIQALRTSRIPDSAKAKVHFWGANYYIETSSGAGDISDVKPRHPTLGTLYFLLKSTTKGFTVDAILVPG